MESRKVNVFVFACPMDWDESVSFANGNGYVWGYQDACRTADVPTGHIPDGFAYAWLEYTRRNRSTRMAIREAFAAWCQNETLPGLPERVTS